MPHTSILFTPHYTFFFLSPIQLIPLEDNQSIIYIIIIIILGLDSAYGQNHVIFGFLSLA
jgi:hypothetical protein